MSDSGQRTEKPTQRRLDRARKEGNYPASKEFVSAIQFVGVVALSTTFAAKGLTSFAGLMRVLLERAFAGDISASGLVALARQQIVPHLVPLMLGGGVLV